MTHWVKGSQVTGQASGQSEFALRYAISAGVVTGVIRSTMALGKPTSPRSTRQPASCCCGSQRAYCAGHVAVVLDVVAGLDGEGREPAARRS